ncbi:ATP-binding protein [Robertkochia aurantiaca]|uniref:ATP-binding protein n=1 Tax=Robertkochia aurantiaca TaxID=2873700 RepID=UPI001CCEA57C|nr:ATP-binding protein [Robertkochia sp. 3YJGBD-33]
MIQSMRAVGYDFGMAVSDIVDNSISAGAKNIWISYCWKGEDSFMTFLDDGSGMTDDELYNAMRLGSTNPKDIREPHDLGRFGMGLKTASFSQCKLLTVASKKEGAVSTRCWDLDLVDEHQEWLLKKTPYRSASELMKGLDEVNSGTMVIWEKPDRLLDQLESEQESLDSFLKKIHALSQYLGMVFHRYLETPSRVKIYLGNVEGSFIPVKAWDPFLKTHKATRELSDEAFRIFNNKVNVKPYVLPHISKLEGKEHEEAAGPKGWNAHQGIYLYRKERLIIAGGWLGLGYKQEDHYKLARIMVDIPNSMDQQWHIDVKKAAAKLPDVFANNLKKMAKVTREKASEAYRFRGKYGARKTPSVNRFVWKKTEKKGKTSYKVDKEHPVVNQLLGELKDHKLAVTRLLKLIESTVPVETIIIDNAEKPDSLEKEKHVITSRNFPLKEWFEDFVDLEIQKGVAKEDAFRKVLSMEPFIDYPELYALIENYE